MKVYGLQNISALELSCRRMANLQVPTLPCVLNVPWWCQELRCSGCRRWCRSQSPTGPPGCNRCLPWLYPCLWRGLVEGGHQTSERRRSNHRWIPWWTLRRPPSYPAPKTRSPSALPIDLRGNKRPNQNNRNSSHNAPEEHIIFGLMGKLHP